MEIKKAVRRGIKGRVAICGPTGSGKTLTGLKFAEVFGKNIGVIDSEYGSASLYADIVPFDVIELYGDYSPNKYLEAIESFSNGGYDVLIIDSFSHAWTGKGGILDQADMAAKRMRNPNSYTAWKEATPLHDELINAIKSYPGHVIVTMRSKMDYAQDKDRDGKTTIRKLGMAPIQREGTDYEFDIVCDMDVDHTLVVGKTRCSLIDGMVVKKPDGKFAKIVLDWLNSGAPDPHSDKKPPKAETPAPPKKETAKPSDNEAKLRGRCLAGESRLAEFFQPEAVVELRQAAKCDPLDSATVEHMTGYIDTMLRTYKQEADRKGAA